MCRAISSAANIEISFEGLYNWILFPPSKLDVELPVANRYVGWYRHNELKVRGIEIRRHDTPKFIRLLQERLLAVLARAKNAKEIEQLVPSVLEEARPSLERVRSGKVPPLELVIRKNISHEADEYQNKSVNAVVARQMEYAGMHLAAGESISFIVLDASGKKKPEKAKPLALYALEDGYDIEEYTKLSLKSIETLLSPFGYNVERLMKFYGYQDRQKKKKGKLEDNSHVAKQGDFFFSISSSL